RLPLVLTSAPCRKRSSTASVSSAATASISSWLSTARPGRTHTNHTSMPASVKAKQTSVRNSVERFLARPTISAPSPSIAQPTVLLWNTDGAGLLLDPVPDREPSHFGRLAKRCGYLERLPLRQSCTGHDGKRVRYGDRLGSPVTPRRSTAGSSR